MQKRQPNQALVSRHESLVVDSFVIDIPDPSTLVTLQKTQSASTISAWTRIPKWKADGWNRMRMKSVEEAGRQQHRRICGWEETSVGVTSVVGGCQMNSGLLYLIFIKADDTRAGDTYDKGEMKPKEAG